MQKKIIILAGMIAILAIIVVSHTVRRHRADAQRSQEQTMRANLETIRAALKRYEAKHQVAAASLADLVRDGEIKSIPIDPVTGSSATWKTTLEETVRTDDFSATAPATNAPRIIDVRSGAPGADSSGRRWAEY